MTSPEHPPPHTAWIVAQCSAALAFAAVLHEASSGFRSAVIFIWGFVAVPAVLVPLFRGGRHNVTSVTVWGIITWQALRYCGDMGGPYAHFLAAAPLCLASLVTTPVLLFVGCVRAGRLLAPESSDETPDDH